MPSLLEGIFYYRLSHLQYVKTYEILLNIIFIILI